MTMWYWALAIALHILQFVTGGSELELDVTDPVLAVVEVTPFLDLFLETVKGQFLLLSIYSNSYVILI